MDSPTYSGSMMPGASTFLNRFYATMINAAFWFPSHAATRTASYLTPTATLAAPANSTLSLLFLLLIFASLSGAALVQFRLRRASPHLDIGLSLLVESPSTDDLQSMSFAFEGSTLVNPDFSEDIVQVVERNNKGHQEEVALRKPVRAELPKDAFDSPILKSGIVAAYRDAVVMSARINQTDDTLVALGTPSSYPKFSNAAARVVLSKKREALTIDGRDSVRPPHRSQVPSFTMASTSLGADARSKPHLCHKIGGLLARPSGKKPEGPLPSLTQSDKRMPIPVEPSGVPGSGSPYLAEVRRIFETPLDAPLRRRKFADSALIADSPYQARVRNIFERAMGENDKKRQENGFAVGRGSPSASRASADGRRVETPSGSRPEKRRVPFERAQARLDELTRSVRSRTGSTNAGHAEQINTPGPAVSTAPRFLNRHLPSNFIGGVSCHVVTEAEEAAQRAARLSQLHDVLETSAAKRPPPCAPPAHHDDDDERAARLNAIVDEVERILTHAGDRVGPAESPPLLGPTVSDVVYKVPTLPSRIVPPTHELPRVIEDVFYTPQTPLRKKQTKPKTIRDISFDDEIADLIPGFGVGSPATRRRQRLRGAQLDYFSTSTPPVNCANFGVFSSSTPTKGYNNRRDTWADFF